jgi:uncharacterized protein (DUF1697 family)
MPHYIAFLRGINLGNRRVKMDVLRAHFDALKFAAVETFIASGNVIFSSRATDPDQLATTIATHLERSLGYPVDTFLRTRSEVSAIAARHPFGLAVIEDPGHTLQVGFFARELTSAQAHGLLACRSPHDEFRVEGREYYWLCRGIKSSESKIWASAELRALGLPSSSMRNFTTIRRLAALYPPPGA